MLNTSSHETRQIARRTDVAPNYQDSRANFEWEFLAAPGKTLTRVEVT
jgi:hypothetical protein